MIDLGKIAERAKADARRADVLRIAIKTLEDHGSGAMVTFTTDFIGANGGHHADAEVAVTLKRLWPQICAETLEASKSELQQIEARYASLMSEVPSDG